MFGEGEKKQKEDELILWWLRLYPFVLTVHDDDDDDDDEDDEDDADFNDVDNYDDDGGVDDYY